MDLADNSGTIIYLPGRAAEVSADLPLLIKEARLGRLE
jgi:hypothetical protein